MVKLTTAIADAESKLQLEIDNAVESVHNQYLAALAQEQSLQRELDRQKGDAVALNRSGVDYDVLKREAESNKQIYATLMQRAKETGITGELKSSNIRIVDLAEVPRRPVRPNKTVNLLLGLIAGALSAVGVAAFFEYLDNRIKNPDDIKRHLGVPFLGLVPAIPAKELKGASPILTAGVPVSFGESMRAVRTNVLFSSAEAGCRSLVVTSTQPGEGKSVISANLAVALAQTGKRVLLIDADMRKPRLQDIFGIALEPGLSNTIVGTAKATESIVKSGTPNLWMLPAGLYPPNPAELLGSARFRSLIEQVAAHFDWVVVDSPPVLAVTDVSVFAHMMTGVVFVIGSEQTTRQAAMTAVEQLHAVAGDGAGGGAEPRQRQQQPVPLHALLQAHVHRLLPPGAPRLGRLRFRHAYPSRRAQLPRLQPLCHGHDGPADPLRRRRVLQPLFAPPRADGRSIGAARASGPRRSNALPSSSSPTDAARTTTASSG